MMTESKITGIHHIAMNVRDFDKSCTFYTEGLGLKEWISWKSENTRAVMLDTGNGSFLELFEGPYETQTQQGTLLHIALRTNDCDAAFEKACAAGAKTMSEPQDVDIPSSVPMSVRIAFCTGPDGEILEFFQIRTDK